MVLGCLAAPPGKARQCRRWGWLSRTSLFPPCRPDGLRNELSRKQPTSNHSTRGLSEAWILDFSHSGGVIKLKIVRFAQLIAALGKEVPEFLGVFEDPSFTEPLGRLRGLGCSRSAIRHAPPSLCRVQSRLLRQVFPAGVSCRGVSWHRGAEASPMWAAGGGRWAVGGGPSSAASGSQKENSSCVCSWPWQGQPKLCR